MTDVLRITIVLVFRHISSRSDQHVRNKDPETPVFTQIVNHPPDRSGYHPTCIIARQTSNESSEHSIKANQWPPGGGRAVHAGKNCYCQRSDLASITWPLIAGYLRAVMLEITQLGDRVLHVWSSILSPLARSDGNREGSFGRRDRNIGGLVFANGANTTAIADWLICCDPIGERVADWLIFCLRKGGSARTLVGEGSFEKF